MVKFLTFYSFSPTFKITQKSDFKIALQIKYAPEIREMIKDDLNEILKKTAFWPRRVMRRRLTRSLSRRDVYDWDKYINEIKDVWLSYGRFNYLQPSIFDFRMRDRYQEQLDDILAAKDIDPNQKLCKNLISDIPIKIKEAKDTFLNRQKQIMLDRIRLTYKDL